MFLGMFSKTQNIVQTMHLTMLIAHPYLGGQVGYSIFEYPPYPQVVVAKCSLVIWVGGLLLKWQCIVLTT